MAPTTAFLPIRAISGGKTKIPTCCPTWSIAGRLTSSWPTSSQRPEGGEAFVESTPPGHASSAERAGAEPLVQSPIFMTWGPDGKMWVVEMGDYPLGLDGKYKPGGKIKYLEDTNGDGKYTKAT